MVDAPLLSSVTPTTSASEKDLLGETIVVTLSAIVALVMRNLPLTHDVMWQLWVSRQMVGGIELYRQINEVNPPLWFWTAMPMHRIAASLHLPTTTIVVWFILALALASSLLVGRIGRFEGPRERALAMTITLVVGLFTSLYDFAQREQILLIGAIPYALLIAARIRRERPSLLIAGTIALLASYGFALKHYFVLVPLGLEALLLLHLRSDWHPLRTETIILAVLGAAYAGAVLILTPAFLTIIVPMVNVAYFGFDTPAWMWFDEPIQAFWVLELGVLMMIGAPKLMRERPEMQTLAVSVIAAFAAYLLQRKGWQYHAVPTSGLMLMLLSSIGWARGQRVVDLMSKPLLCVIIALYITFSFAQRPYDNDRERLIGHFIDMAPSGSPVLIVASNPMWGWPVVENHHRVWASRYIAHWMLPAFGRAHADRNETPALLALEKQVREDTYTDMICAAPSVIVIENHEPNFVIRPRDFDTLAFFAKDKLFANYLAQNYRMIENGWYLRAYLRTGPDSRAAPAGCRRVVPPFRTI